MNETPTAPERRYALRFLDGRLEVRAFNRECVSILEIDPRTHFVRTGQHTEDGVPIFQEIEEAEKQSQPVRLELEVTGKLLLVDYKIKPGQHFRFVGPKPAYVITRPVAQMAPRAGLDTRAVIYICETKVSLLALARQLRKANPGLIFMTGQLPGEMFQQWLERGIARPCVALSVRLENGIGCKPVSSRSRRARADGR